MKDRHHVKKAISSIIMICKGKLLVVVIFKLLTFSAFSVNAQIGANRNTDINLYAQQGDMALGANYIRGIRGNYSHHGLGAKFFYNITDVFRLAAEYDFFPEHKSISWWDFSVYAHHYLVTNSSRLAIYPLVRFGYAGSKINSESMSFSEKWFAFSLGGGIDFALTSNLIFNIETRYELFGDNSPNEYRSQIVNGYRANFTFGLVYRFMARIRDENISSIDL